MNQKAQIFWLRDAVNNPVACIYSILIYNEAVENEVFFVDFGLSIRHPKDKFSKEIGRRIAAGRSTVTLGNMSGVLEFTDPVDFREARRRILKQVMKMAAVPTRIKKMAQEWLDRSSSTATKNRAAKMNGKWYQLVASNSK